MSKNSTTQNNFPIAICDTNIFGNLYDKYTSKETSELISNLSENFILAISKITIMEITALGSKDSVRMLKTMNAFKKFEVDDEVLAFAGLIFCTKKVNGHNDSIIASTAFLNSSFLLTANQKDFKEPFFHEIDCWHIHHKDDGNRTIAEHIYLLEVDPKTVSEELNKIELVKEIPISN